MERKSISILRKNPSSSRFEIVIQSENAGPERVSEMIESIQKIKLKNPGQIFALACRENDNVSYFSKNGERYSYPQEF